MLIHRRTLLASIGASALLAACSGGVGDQDDASDMSLGDPKAPIRFVEYASVTCPHCKEWHDTVWAQFKTNYIDAGKVHFIFREFPTNPPELAVAGFQIARCGGATPEQYFNRLDVLFGQQEEIFNAYENNSVNDKLLQVAQSMGIAEADFRTCIADPAGTSRINDTVDAGKKRFNVTGTPTFIIDGKVAGPDAYTYPGLSKMLDKLIAAKGK